MSSWRAFATDLLGLEASEGGAGRLYLRADLWHHRLVLEQDDCDDLIGAGLRVAGPDEFRAMQEQLRDHNVAYEVADDETAQACHVLELLTLADPNGNPLEIFHGPRVDAHRPFHPGRGMYGRFVTGLGGIGHMILGQKDIAATYEFYRLLGMRGNVEYRVPMPDGQMLDILFMHCNDRDHTLAFGPPAKKRIDHLMLEVDNLDDVFHTFEIVQKSQYPVVTTPGRHANDRNFSFYCASPSGFRIEIGWGARPPMNQSEYYTRDMYGHTRASKPA